VGLEYVPVLSLKGGDSATNARTLREVLSGTKGPARQAVVLNAAFAIVAGGKADSVRDGILVAEQSIDSGAAAEKLKRFLSILGRKKGAETV
jgi:anthranilate phosphoribosyltransferase